MHERNEDRVLVGEVLVERADRYAGSLGDPVGGPGGVALTFENLSSRLDDGLHRRLRPCLLGSFRGSSRRSGMRVDDMRVIAQYISMPVGGPRSARVTHLTGIAPPCRLYGLLAFGVRMVVQASPDGLNGLQGPTRRLGVCRADRRVAVRDGGRALHRGLSAPACGRTEPHRSARRRGRNHPRGRARLSGDRDHLGRSVCDGRCLADRRRSRRAHRAGRPRPFLAHAQSDLRGDDSLLHGQSPCSRQTP